MFHDMGFLEGDEAAGLEGHDVDMGVVGGGRRGSTKRVVPQRFCVSGMKRIGTSRSLITKCFGMGVPGAGS